MIGTTCGEYHTNTILLLCSSDQKPLTDIFYSHEELIKECQLLAGQVVTRQLQLEYGKIKVIANSYCRNCKKSQASNVCGNLYTIQPAICVSNNYIMKLDSQTDEEFQLQCEQLQFKAANKQLKYYSVSSSGLYCPEQFSTAANFCTPVTNSFANCGQNNKYEWCPGKICIASSCGVSFTNDQQFQDLCKKHHGSVKSGIIEYGKGIQINQPLSYQKSEGYYCQPNDKFFYLINKDMMLIFVVSFLLWCLFIIGVILIWKNIRHQIRTVQKK